MTTFAVATFSTAVTAFASAVATLATAITAFAASLGEFGAIITFVSNVPGETRTLPLAIYSALQSPGGEAAAARLAMLSIVLALVGLTMAEILAALEAMFREKGEGRVKFKIRYDIECSDKILVFDDRDNFICEAERTEKIHPAALQLGDASDAERLKAALQHKKGLTAATKAIASQMLETGG